MENNERKIFGIYYGYLLIAAASFISWLPVLTLPFMNDDYQILGFHSGSGFASLLKPFFSPDISNVYWRPLGNLLHPLVLMMVGFTPAAFRLLSIVLYFFCCLAVAKGSESLGLSRKTAAWSGVIFALLPSHELQVTWIADQGEALVTIFLIYTLINYMGIYKNGFTDKKKIIYTLACFISALLIKESAFAGILIPAVSLAAAGEYTKNKILITLRDSLAGLIILSVTLLYRKIIIGGTPFASSHFAGGIKTWFINFVIYPPLAVFPPEALEAMQSYAKHFAIAGLFLFAFFCVVLFFLYKKYFTLKFFNIHILTAGILWYLIFILPGLPTLMRWYAFTASAGLIWAVSAAAQGFVLQGKSAIYIKGALLTLLLLAAGYNFGLMLKYHNAGSKFAHAVESIEKNKNDLKHDTVFVFGVPDKIRRVAVMKLGVNETFQWALGDKHKTVNSPLRAELLSSKSFITLVGQSDSGLAFHLTGGRFLFQGGESKYMITEEKQHRFIDGINIRILTFPDHEGVPHSLAWVKLDRPVNCDEMYFDGEDFKVINRPFRQH